MYKLFKIQEYNMNQLNLCALFILLVIDDFGDL